MSLNPLKSSIKIKPNPSQISLFLSPSLSCGLPTPATVGGRTPFTSDAPLSVASRATRRPRCRHALRPPSSTHDEPPLRAAAPVGPPRDLSRSKSLRLCRSSNEPYTTSLPPPVPPPICPVTGPPRRCSFAPRSPLPKAELRARPAPFPSAAAAPDPPPATIGFALSEQPSTASDPTPGHPCPSASPSSSALFSVPSASRMQRPTPAALSPLDPPPRHYSIRSAPSRPPDPLLRHSPSTDLVTVEPCSDPFSVVSRSSLRPRFVAALSPVPP